VSRKNLAQDVEDRRISVDEGVQAGMVCRERKGEQARDLLRGDALGKNRGQHHPACRILVLIADREIRRIFLNPFSF
jgi:hypothetical protein